MCRPINGKVGCETVRTGDALCLAKGNARLESSLFKFIWKYSRREQIKLLIFTLALFPLLYLSLELPKRIINDAIEAPSGSVTVFGWQIDQIPFLMLLSVLFLVTVTVHGLLKMRVNTMKGLMAEDLLRRLRYTLIGRIIRFPSDYLDRTSEGELVSMVMGETEPMGGLMGDAISQPVLQAGQMLTILAFLFSQSWAFGLAAVAFIPLQGWLIPKLQRRVNLLNKKRVVHVRALAGDIGTSAAGATTLRTNGGWGYLMSLINDRLGNLVAIRFQIYQKKFFMKFANNFISQLTPFFFYSVGGYLVIRGDVTIGALVAALAAFKDLSAPWKELLAYYTTSQELGLRWEMISDRFSPSGMVENNLFEGDPQDGPVLTGDIELSGLNLRNSTGELVLSEADLVISKGQTTLVVAASEEDRRALAYMLMRELKPTFGSVRIAQHDLAGLHQKTIFQRLGFANSRPVVFDGTFLDNLMLPLYRLTDADKPFLLTETEQHLQENKGRLRDWWLEFITTLDLSDALFARGLTLRLPDDLDTPLAKALPAMRARVAARIEAEGLSQNARFFAADTYNPALSVAENVLFAIAHETPNAEKIAEQSDFQALLDELHLEKALFDTAFSIVEILLNIFGDDGSNHPLFRKLDLEEASYHHVADLLARSDPAAKLTTQDKSHLLAVLFAISSEKLGVAFDDDVVAVIMNMRAAHAPALQASLADVVTPLAVDTSIPGLTIQENAMFGRAVPRTPGEAQHLKDVVGEVLEETCKTAVLDLILELPVSRKSSNLPAQLSEILSLCRATIKRPDMVIMDEPLASFDQDVRKALPQRLRTLLPEATILVLSASDLGDEACDKQVRLYHGMLVDDTDETPSEQGGAGKAELDLKIQALSTSKLFSSLGRKQQRLLAFGARWYKAAPGEYIFHAGDAPDSGVFLIVEGSADLLRAGDDGTEVLVTNVGAGSLVGELGLIRQEPRALHMRASDNLVCLNIGQDEFMSVIQHDAATAYRVLQIVAGYI